MTLPLRKIGNAEVHPIGFGAMGISAFYGKVESDEERFKVLDAVYASGCRHIDTAHIYADSEVLLGKWFKKTGKRDEIFLATKFGITPQGPRGDPEFVKEQFATSLERLGVETIDLYYQHRPDPKVPIEITVGAMAELVKYVGAYFPNRSFVLDIESEEIGLLKTARELGVTIVAYSPLARGLLTGQYKSPDDFEEGDFRRTVPKYQAENFPKILDVVKQIEVIGRKHNATAGQVTLAWILAQGDDFVVIPGTKKIKYVKENMGAAGNRYAEKHMQVVLVKTPPLSK